MIEVPRISDLLDAHLLAKRDAEGEREITGGATWRASKIGSCLRQQYLQFHVKQPRVEEFSALALRRFEVGHAWGRQFAQWFRDMGHSIEEEVELVDRELDLGAHVDFVIDGAFGVELKSVNSKWFWYRAKSGETTASPENMMQAACYDLLWQKTRNYSIPWVVLTVSKDDLTMEQDLVTQEHRDEAQRRINLLNAAKVTGLAPPCTCLDSWGWKYCPYYEGDREEGRKKGAKPAGECCVVREEEPAWL